MPPHLKILSNLRKAKRQKKNTQRKSTAAVTAKGSAHGKAEKGVPAPHVHRVNKLAALLSAPTSRKTSGPKPTAPVRPGKPLHRSRAK
jgi:hypothetical protein